MFDHVLFTFNRKRMGLLTSALLCAKAETTGQVSRTMQPIHREAPHKLLYYCTIEDALRAQSI